MIDTPDLPPAPLAPPPSPVTPDPGLDQIAQMRKLRLGKRANRQSLIVDPGLNAPSAPSGPDLRVPGT